MTDYNGLCDTCDTDCEEPFTTYTCERYTYKMTDSQILSLFHGMSKTMQHSIIEIMKVTQGEPNDK